MTVTHETTEPADPEALDSVHLTMDHSPAPGVQWEYDVLIESLKEGHRVIAQSWETGRSRIVRRSRKTLSWRVAVKDVLELEDTWLWIDDLHAVSVWGLPEWQADIVRLAVCKVDANHASEPAFLIQFSDSALIIIEARWGRLIDTPALEVIRGLEETFLRGGNLDVIEKMLLTCSDEQAKDVESWLETVTEACAACKTRRATHPFRTRFSAAKIEAITSSHDLLKIMKGPQPSSHTLKWLIFQQWHRLLLHKTFERNNFGTSFESFYDAADWIVHAWHSPGDLARDAEAHPELRAVAAQVRAFLDDFIRYVRTMPPATTWNAGFGRFLAGRAAARAESIRRHAFGDS